MKVTISDVARLAGVSTATVSHTINNTRYVSGETKDKTDDYSRCCRQRKYLRSPVAFVSPDSLAGHNRTSYAEKQT